MSLLLKTDTRGERKIVGLVGMSGPGRLEPELLDWLTENLPVRFEERKPDQLDALDAVIFIGGHPNELSRLVSARIPSLAVFMQDTEKSSLGDVVFSSSELVPAVLRSRPMHQEFGPVWPLSIGAGDEVLATLAGQPVWTARNERGLRSDSAAMSLPRIDPARGARDYFIGRNFFQLLPLVDFVRRVSGEAEWTAPPLRACYMFDDPNLHSSSYGWLDYREVVEHAAEHNYHAAFATIPLDGWYASAKAAAFFTGEQSRLSLLIHGNDHVYEELSSFANEDEAVSHLAQALLRIERFEQRTGVQVSRVMAPPHGTCSELAMKVMAQLGFEAVCTTLSWLALRNPDRAWTQRLGLNIAEVVAGTPVIARFRLDSLPRNATLLAAYLGQPIILYGHHQSVANGISGLDELADYIHSLGDVQWMNMRGISRKNYKTRKRNGLLEVRAYARLFEIMIPSGTDWLSVQRPWLDGGQPEALRIRAGHEVKVFQNYAGEPLPVVPGAQLEIESIHHLAMDPNAVRMPKPRAQPFLRRQLCSLRDRLQPIARFVHPGNGKQSASI